MLRRRMNTTFFILLIALVTYVSYLILEPFLDFIVGALLLTFVFYPLYMRLLPRLRYPALASSIVILIIFLIVVMPVFFAVWSLASDVAQLSTELDVEDVTGLLADFDAAVARLTGFEILHLDNQTTNSTTAPVEEPPPDGNSTDGNATGNAATGDATASGRDDNRTVVTKGLLQPGDLTRFVLPQIESLLGRLVNQAFGFILQAALGTFVMLFIMYYGFKDGHRFVQFIEHSLPLRDEYKSDLFEQVDEVVNAVFIGQILVSLVQGALGGIGFWIFGVPNPFFWGFVMTILAILPIIGTPIVWVPAALWLLAIGEVGAGVGLLVWGSVLVSTVDNVLKPKVIGDRAEVHPAIVLLGVVGGIAYFGFIGFLLGPLILAVFVVLVNIFGADFVARHEVHVSKIARGGPPVPKPFVISGTDTGLHIGIEHEHDHGAGPRPRHGSRSGAGDDQGDGAPV